MQWHSEMRGDPHLTPILTITYVKESNHCFHLLTLTFETPPGHCKEFRQRHCPDVCHLIISGLEAMNYERSALVKHL